MLFGNHDRWYRVDVADSFFGLDTYITILLGVVMFGMGLTLKAIHFNIILTNSGPILIGVVAQFISIPIAAIKFRKFLRYLTIYLFL
ncbi:hypothetical protein CSV79_14590 [Sporosarcina sp. P13]|nr:hypothetical protein CSV79_14590 [Sporosarcina sp. P13]